jgi:hypothetical protein
MDNSWRQYPDGTMKADTSEVRARKASLTLLDITTTSQFAVQASMMTFNKTFEEPGHYKTLLIKDQDA